MEVNLDEEKNPMKQDVKNGELRVIKYGKSKWNYGMLPQTWEDSNATLSGTNFKGDGDPLDVVEIGGEKLTRGTVAPVRVLGAIALIDEGELDWKVVAIALSDPNASKLNDIGDVERVLPGKLDAIVEWYRNYKTVDGKGVNQFAFDGKFINRVEALKVIEHCNKAWKKSKKPKAPPKAKKTTA
jgi:inorganic pyrophosphatase